MKNKSKIWIYTFIIMGVVLLLDSSCKKEENKPAKNSGFTCIQDFKDNSYVIDAINAAGTPIYDGNTPPNIEGEYNTYESIVYDACANLAANIGSPLYSILKYFDQTSSNLIKSSEKYPWGYSTGIGAFISGYGEYFTVWQECSNSDGSTTIMIMSGHKIPNSDILEMKSVTVYTDNPSSGFVQGDWWACSPKLVYISNDTVTIINELFITDPGWATYSVASNKNWAHNSTYTCMQVNNYAGDVAGEDWLFTPEIDLNGMNSASLSFQTWSNYSDAGQTDPLQILVSDNYVIGNNPNYYTWTQLTATLCPYNLTFTPSGNIDLTSFVNKNIRLAWRYRSSGTTAGNATSWEVTNVVVQANH